MIARQPPTSDGTGRRPSTYDLLLFAIPLPLLAGVLLGTTTAVPLPFGTGGGGLVAAAVVGYGLFARAPTVERGSGRTGGFAPADD